MPSLQTIALIAFVMLAAGAAAAVSVAALALVVIALIAVVGQLLVWLLRLVEMLVQAARWWRLSADRSARRVVDRWRGAR